MRQRVVGRFQESDNRSKRKKGSTHAFMKKAKQVIYEMR